MHLSRNSYKYVILQNDLCKHACRQSVKEQMDPELRKALVDLEKTNTCAAQEDLQQGM